MNIKNLNVTLGNRQSSVDSNLVTWFLDGKPFIADWQNPVLSRLFNNDKNGLGANTNIYEMSGDAKSVSYYDDLVAHESISNPSLVVFLGHLEQRTRQSGSAAPYSFARS